MTADEALCGGPNADNRNCPVYWSVAGERDKAYRERDSLARRCSRYFEEQSRLRGLIRELLENTGLDDEQQAEWLDRAGIHDDDSDGDEGDYPDTADAASLDDLEPI